jgi:6-phosphofructokinase
VLPKQLRHRATSYATELHINLLLPLQMCEENDVLCNVIGVPKSIDNDILLIDKCFGFDTAVEEAQRALLAAKVGGAGNEQLFLFVLL